MEMKAPRLSVLPDHRLRLQNPGCILQGAAEELLTGSWFVTRAASAELARGSPALGCQRGKPFHRKNMVSQGQGAALAAPVRVWGLPAPSELRSDLRDPSRVPGLLGPSTYITQIKP